MPEYLYRLEHPNETDFAWMNNRPSTRAPARTPMTPYPARKGRAPIPRTTTTVAYDDEQFGGDADYDVLEDEEETTTRRTTPRLRPRNTTRYTTISTTPAGPKEESKSISEENVWVGIMFGSKALVQLIANPFVGPLTNK